MTWFNLTYIFNPHQIFNVSCYVEPVFSKWFYSPGKQKEKNICLQVTYLEPIPSFFIFFSESCKVPFVQDFFLIMYGKQNDSNWLFGVCQPLTCVFLKIILWLFPFQNDNSGNIIASCYLNLFQANVPFLYPLKTSEWIPLVFLYFQRV